MTEKRIQLKLDADLHARLKTQAEREGITLPDLIRAWLMDKLAESERAATLPAPDALWQERFERLMEKMRSGVPPDMSPQEIEREITLARAEAREIRRARRS